MTTIFEDDEKIGDRYKIDHYLDAGGMQEVYVAYDNILKKKVALKTPKNDHAEKRFERSARLSAKVNHPNIARTLDYFNFEGRDILIEELIDGKSLNKALEDDYDYFDPYLLAQFGHHLAKGVAASHHVGVIHRDLKPGNIMIEKYNNIYRFKVTDFGIAKLAEEEMEEASKSDDTTLASKTMMGAIPYMAPEMIEGTRFATDKSDIWAIGAIVYRLMTGELLFGAGLKAIPKIQEAKLPDDWMKEYHKLIQFKWLIDEIWNILNKCLLKEKTKRPSADDLVNQFSKLCYGIFPKYIGTVRDFRSGSGAWGFISSAGGDVFFHRQCFYGEFSEIVDGKQVEFSAHKGGGADRAYPVLPIKQT